MNKLIIFAIAIIVLYFLFNNNQLQESFYNIKPTEAIDASYYNYNQDLFNYKTHKRVGDLYGVDLNCNNVNAMDVLNWIQCDDPNILYECVYRYDPSVNISNPIHTPRIFRELLKNLPEKSKYLPIIRKCFPMQIGL